jgi:hypothetical protein
MTISVASYGKLQASYGKLQGINPKVNKHTYSTAKG